MIPLEAFLHFRTLDGVITVVGAYTGHRMAEYFIMGGCNILHFLLCMNH